MTARTKSPQELFWAGEFGTEYTERNVPEPQAKAAIFKEIMERTFGVRSILEVACNRGHNLAAFKLLSDNYEIFGIDVNESALKEAAKVPGLKTWHSSLQDFNPGRTFDLVHTGGVLTHLCPEDLPLAYKKLYDLSSRYIVIHECFNPTPMEVEYRGHAERLYKRDFASEFIDANGGNLRVVDYKFLWARVSPNGGNSTWFLLEKTNQG
jgi:pseudaminic acid biosynthesis-associated methylase